MEALAARGGELECRFGFGVVRQLFEAAVRDRRSAPRLLAGRARLAAPVLGVELGPDGPPAPRDPGEAAFAVQHGLYWLTAQLSERRPVALIVDDAHWADPESLRFLVHLARRLEDLPVLLAVAMRPAADGDRLLHRLAATPGAEVLAPAPLSAAASGEIVRSLAPDADDEVCRICHARAGGNPFYLRELANGLRSERLERGPAAADRLARWSPERVTRYVGARVAAVPSAARSLARAAAILGQDAHAGHAAAIARLDQRDRRRSRRRPARRGDPVVRSRTCLRAPDRPLGGLRGDARRGPRGRARPSRAAPRRGRGLRRTDRRAADGLRAALRPVGVRATRRGRARGAGPWGARCRRRLPAPRARGAPAGRGSRRPAARSRRRGGNGLRARPGRGPPAPGLRGGGRAGRATAGGAAAGEFADAGRAGGRGCRAGPPGAGRSARTTRRSPPRSRPSS